jgi:hypothetical protein
LPEEGKMENADEVKTVILFRMWRASDIARRLGIPIAGISHRYCRRATGKDEGL